MATASEVHRDAISSDQINMFSFRYFEMQFFDMSQPYNSTCTERASVENRLLCRYAIQWFQIHHDFTFVTIHNPAVYLSGARFRISPTLVPRLLYVGIK